MPGRAAQRPLRDGPPEVPPVPEDPPVGVPPTFTSGVVPGTDELLGLASLPRVIGLGPRSRAPGPTPPTGGVTPVLPAPPVVTCCAQAGPATIAPRVARTTSFVRIT